MTEKNEIMTTETTKMLKFLGEKDYQPEKFVTLIKAGHEEVMEVGRRTAELILATGAALIVAKNETQHGGWGSFVNQCGIADRTAQRYMDHARKAADMKYLTRKMLDKGYTLEKIGAVLALPYEDAEAVVGDDRISRMTGKEVREELRKLTEERDGLKDKIKKGRDQLADKEDENSRLRAENLREMVGPTAAKIYKAMELLALALSDDVPAEDDKRLQFSAMASAAFDNATKVYNKFRNAGGNGNGHEIPENMQEIIDEMGDLSDLEDIEE